jgi:hypothetical protein
MYGIDAAKKGAQDYYDSLFALYASWGVDYVKVDDICNTNMYPNAPYSGKAEIELIRRAIDRSGRAMVLSLSPGPALIDEAWHLREHANLWRITDDFWDRWDLLKDMFRRCELWQNHVVPGSWPDCDMLPLGHIGMGFRHPRYTNFTRDEQRTMMTLWCVFRSPLMMGGELNDNDDWTLSLLNNDEVLDVSKFGSRPRQISRNQPTPPQAAGYGCSHKVLQSGFNTFLTSLDATQVATLRGGVLNPSATNEAEAIWMNTAESGDTNLALFNLSDSKRMIRCPFDTLGSSLEKAAVRDLWNKRDMGIVEKEIVSEIPPHGAMLYRMKNIGGADTKKAIQ